MSDDQLLKELVTFKDVAHHFAPIKAEYDRRQLAKTVTQLLEVANILVQETVKLSVLTRALKWMTFVLGVIAAIQTFIMVLEYCSKMH